MHTHTTTMPSILLSTDIKYTGCTFQQGVDCKSETMRNSDQYSVDSSSQSKSAQYLLMKIKMASLGFFKSISVVGIEPVDFINISTPLLHPLIVYLVRIN